MAERPIFIPDANVAGFVREVFLPITWRGGFAPIQKKKNIAELHQAAANAGMPNVLEISTKSEEKLGQRLSAFNLRVHTDVGDIPLECAYQGSKVFERGGPYVDLYEADVRVAKRDPRLKESGMLQGFLFFGFQFPLEPKTVFYDWLYINAIYPHREWLRRIFRYDGFTDIEFNPNKSLNCQARSCALFVSLMKLNLLDAAIESPSEFIELNKRYFRRTDSFRAVPQGNQRYF